MEYHILFVDDNEVILKSLEALFADAPLILHFARDGAEALALLRQKSFEPAVIVSDQRMPEITGTELLYEAKKLYPNAMRIILTGHQDFQTALEGINRSGIYRLIIKPWEKSDLKQVIKEALRHYHLHLENDRLKEEVMQKNKELTAFNDKLEGLVAERTQVLQEVYARISSLTLELQEKVSELEGHEKINKHLLTVHNLQDTLEVILTVICEIAEAEQALIYGLNAGNNLELIAAAGYGEGGNGITPFEVQDDDGAGLVSAQEVFITHKEKMIGFDASLANVMGFQSVFLPVVKDNQYLAVLEVRKIMLREERQRDVIKSIDQYLTPLAIAISDSLVEKDLPGWEAELDDVLQSFAAK